LGFLDVHSLRQHDAKSVKKSGLVSIWQSRSEGELAVGESWQYDVA
jgi:hypothetical protein